MTYDELKKYYFEVNSHMDELMEDRYLSLDRSDGVFFFSHLPMPFDEEEIDNFPKEIQGAINCGFLEQTRWVTMNEIIS